MREEARFAESVLFVGNPLRDLDLVARLKQHCGSNLTIVTSVQIAARTLGGERFGLVLFDLDYARDGVLELVEELENGERTRNIALVGFSTEYRLEAKEAMGISELATRGELRAGMEELLGRYLSPANFSPANASVAREAEAEAIFHREELIDRMMGNEKLAKSVIQVFLEDTPQQLLALAEAIGRQDVEKSTRIAHSIRGSAANIGGSSLIGLTQEIERAGMEGDLEPARRLLPELERRFANLAPLLKEFCE